MNTTPSSSSPSHTTGATHDADAGTPALWQQLQATATALVAVRGGQSAVAALDNTAQDMRPGVQALLFLVLRWLGQAEALRRKLAPRNPPPLVDALLCTALALCWREQAAPYEPFTLVDQAVEAAKRHPGMRPQSSFVNACLRRFLRERDALLQATAGEPLALWNHPRWWIDRLRQDHPRHWQDILHTNATQAPMTLRVNVRKTSVQRYMQQLQDAGIQAQFLGASAIMLLQPRPVHDVPGFAQGLVSVQDAAAQLAAPLLLEGLQSPAGTATKRLKVLDACAAPGGKTSHLLELRDCDVTAIDIDAQRCELIRQNLQRLELQARVLAADAREPMTWASPGEQFDAILLDAPCTASGIVRRHPDVRWLRRESDIQQLAIVQAALLSTLWPLVKVGGRLLYCTCSVFKAEGVHQIESFVAHHPHARWLPSPGHLLPQTWNAQPHHAQGRTGDHDGFFYALLEKHGD